MSAIQKPAYPGNYSVGRYGSPINLIVVHTMQGFLNGTASWFANPAARVSAHYGVGLDGTIHQYVDESNTAWGAGVWSINTRAVQIEFEDANQPFTVSRTNAQYQAGGALIADIAVRHGMEINRDVIKKHNEVSNSHPNCPGNLDLDRLVASAAMAGTPVAPPTSGDVNAVVQITVDVLNARTGPHLSDPVVAHFFRGQATITGWTTGDEVSINGRSDNVWLRSQAGHWAAQAGTSANFGHAPARLTPNQHVHLATSQATGAVMKAFNLKRRSK